MLFLLGSSFCIEKGTEAINPVKLRCPGWFVALSKIIHHSSNLKYEACCDVLCIKHCQVKCSKLFAPSVVCVNRLCAESGPATRSLNDS